MDNIKVMVAEDEEGVRDVLTALVASDPSLTLVGTAAEADTAIALATEERPDVALLDVRMPGGGGLRAAREIARRSPPTKIIALSAHEDSDTVLSMLMAGASAYVAKSDPTDEILRAIHQALELPQQALDENEMERVLNAFDTTRDHLEARPSVADMQRRRIERALRPGGLAAQLRPIVDLRARELVGADTAALFRTGPERSNDAWFAEARTVGKHVALELRLVREAFGQLDQVPEPAWVAVNVSPDTICSARLAKALEGVPVDRVVLAISELDPIADDGAFEAALARLRSSGFRVAVDDAGTGIASLRHLRWIGPDFVRIDETLTRRIDTDPTRGVLTGTVVSFCAGIGAEVIAKRVDSWDAGESLAELGVRYAQGDFLSDSLGAEE